MEHFIDLLTNRTFDFGEEILALESLFHTPPNVSRYRNNPPSYYFKFFFLQWPHRTNYISFETFFQKAGLERLVVKCHEDYSVTKEEYIYYCEYMLNVINSPPVCGENNCTAIRENIENVLDKMNYIIHCCDSGYHIIENNVLVAEAADAVQDNYDLGESIYSFNYRENKGDVRKKADVLCRLYKYLEDIEKQAKSYGYSNLVEDIKELSNKLDIRHAPTQRQTDVIKGMQKEEYETWLDELFKLFLSLIVLVDYTEKRKDIKALKAELG